MTDNKQSIKGDNNTQNFTIYHNKIASVPSNLAHIMPEIESIIGDVYNTDNGDSIVYSIENKIKFNNLNRFKDWIQKFSSLENDINTIYDEYDSNQTGFKSSVNNYFRTKYRLMLDTYQSKAPDQTIQTIVEKHADDIIRSIFDEFLSALKQKDNTVSMENLETVAMAIVCYAFINCQILEKPPEKLQ